MNNTQINLTKPLVLLYKEYTNSLLKTSCVTVQYTNSLSNHSIGGNIATSSQLIIMNKNSIIKISVIKEATEKGFQTLQCSVSNGFAVNSKPTYILSTPEAIKAAELVEGMDISEMVHKMDMKETTTKSIDTSTGEEFEFNWLTV